ncbi:MAG: alpha/beta fold hydrolase [Candidatus Pseudobacter hemicellulosilyticus]|uniref:Alpha/beta fold hydrolase n=1 Tax=Candidatus Pseudobacter hemicellulosilyticus TaxID=3121375 RepID=A0AAJ5WWH5_9BACT|nr:MAG: alpha/beta fold hydrolase [Pseudobacter sp.]
MKKQLILFCLLLVTALGGTAQSINGSWSGTLSFQGMEIPLIFHIQQATDGSYTTTMDSPKQGAKGLATKQTTLNGQELLIDASNLGIQYKGLFEPDSNRITGTFSQGGANLPLVLTNGNIPEKREAIKVKRPQDPTSFPYKQEEVSFNSTATGVTLAGTLTLPEGKVKKVVVLISGSGPQNRNEELAPFNHRPFLVWSDWLTRQGIAVLRYDDRGVEKSTGNFQLSTTADFANDAEAAVTFLKSRPELKGAAIGLLGHSEGGIIAPMVASRNKDVQFVVMLAGPGVPIPELMVRQNADQLRLSGAPDSMVRSSETINRAIYSDIHQLKDLPEKEFATALEKAIITQLTKAAPSADTNVLQDAAKGIAGPISSPWYRYFLGIDPATYLSKVKCSVLAINGSLDSQVSSEPNLAAIRTALQQAGNKKAKVIDLPGLNHLFQQASTGSVQEYGQLEETVNPAALQLVSDWILTLK